MKFRSGLLAAAMSAVMATTSACTLFPGESSEPSVQQPTVSAASEQTSTSAPETETCPIHTELDSMDVRTKVAQLLTVGVANADDARWAVNDIHVGGIFIGSDVAEQILASGQLPELRRQAPFPLMVTIDEEGGRVSRMDVVAGPLPSAREMAQMPVEEVRNLARLRGEELKRLGITVDFAPSIDVSAQPDDDVIGDRSFSTDPQVVADYARAFADGLLDAGITPVFKHFPGHGRSTGDSHMSEVAVPPLEELRDYDLRPFAQLVGMPRTAVMMGHLDAPGITAPGEPASMSPNAYAMLRSGEAYGGVPYNGVIFTDDLSGMRAITDNYSVPEAVLQALIAGADSPLWISTGELVPAVDLIEQAVNDGRYPMEQLDASVQRMSELRSSNGCSE